MVDQPYRSSAYDAQGRYQPWSGDFEPTGQPRSIRAARGGYRAPGFFGFGDIGDVITPSTPRTPQTPVAPDAPATAALRGLFADRSQSSSADSGDGSSQGLGPTTDDFSDFTKSIPSLVGFPSTIPGLIAGIVNNTPPPSLVDLVTSLLGGSETAPSPAEDSPSETGAIGTGGPGAPSGTGTGGQTDSPSETGAPSTGGPGAPSGGGAGNVGGVDTSNSPSESNASQTGGPGAPGGGGGGGGGTSGGDTSGGTSAGGAAGSAGGGDPAGGTYAKGGFVRRNTLRGPNPPGPDQGYAGLQSGEFVIRKPAVEATGLQALRRINARGGPPKPGMSPQSSRPAPKPAVKKSPLAGIRAPRYGSR